MSRDPSKPISDLVGRVVAIRPASGSAVTPHQPPPPGGHPEPVLPPDLQALVDVVGGGSLFGDFRMVREASFHPDAARFVALQRSALDPAPAAVIRAWFRTVIRGLPAGAVDAGEAAEGLIFDCGDYPAACWTPDTARAVRANIDPANPFAPTSPQIAAVLRPIAERMTGRLRRLEMIARADAATAGNYHTGPARESTVEYKLPPPPDHIGKPRVALRGEGTRPDLTFHQPTMSPDDYIRALGHDPDEIRRKNAEAARKAEKP